jgi:hypothetical protein
LATNNSCRLRFVEGGAGTADFLEDRLALRPPLVGLGIGVAVVEIGLDVADELADRCEAAGPDDIGIKIGKEAAPPPSHQRYVPGEGARRSGMCGGVLMYTTEPIQGLAHASTRARQVVPGRAGPDNPARVPVIAALLYYEIDARFAGHTVAC